MRTRFTPLTIAAFGLVALSGLALLVWYDRLAPLASLGAMELSHPLGRWLRAMHAAGAVALVALFLGHVATAVWRAGRAPRLAGAVLVLPLLVMTGLALRGEPWPWPQLPALVLHAATLTVVFALLALPLPLRVSPPAVARRAMLTGLAVVLPAVALLAWLVPPSPPSSSSADAAPRWLWAALLGTELLALSLVAGPRTAQAGGSRLVRRALAVAGAGVLVVSLSFALPRAAPPLASQRAAPALRPLSLSSVEASRVLGAPEGCLACHGAVTGLGASHDPKTMGCAVCHLGHPLRPDADGAHDGMLLVPGNLDAAARTCGRCHAPHVERVSSSLMARANGLVAVDRFVFGEQPVPDGTTSLAELGRSPADEHLRQLCSTCHLGHAKTAPSPVSETSRGGGCVACHLASRPARTDARTNPSGFVHPGLTARVEDASCFGCHSRSARISLSYSGWRDAEGAPALPPEHRTLEDGRAVVRETADVHHEKGMGCTDCHTTGEVMGDGRRHLHEDEATRVRCTSCHRVTPARAAPPDAQSAVLLRLFGDEARPLLVEERSGEQLVNATPLDGGAVEVRSKADGTVHVATPPAAACTAVKQHARVTCQTCHSAWVHRCSGCHTQYDAKAKQWVEYDVPPEATPPTLGVFVRDGEPRIEPFVPGMVLTLNPKDAPAPSPLPESSAALMGPRTRFVRAWAFAAPHTTVRAGRSCASCHLDPLALGYGKGTLSVDDGGWRFEPAHALSPFDGLPQDAWIGFLDGGAAVTTRRGQRPLDVQEQQRVLNVGACLGCHPPERDAALYQRWDESLTKRTPRCVVPASTLPR